MKWKDLFRSAIEEAARQPKTSLVVLFQQAGYKIDDKQKADCPWCGCGKGLTFTKEEDESWTLRCEKDECRASSGVGSVDFLALAGELSEKEAVRKLLDTAGLSHVWRKGVEDAEDEGQDIENEDIPKFIRLPDIGRNPYEDAWSMLTLTDEHAAELAEKRGMPREWAEALGLRSAIPENRTALEPLLDMHPPNKLLRSGLAVRDRGGNLRIADSMCGRAYDQDEGRWVTRANILIPYITEDGGIELLRPHKRSLSNKRWREEEEVAGFYEKLYNNLRIPYGKHFLSMDRDQRWRHNAVIGEGEFKGMALAMCGVPSLCFQGIHFFLQNKIHKQAIEDTVRILRAADIRQTLVVFDNEDKSHKPFPEQFETETFARYTAECLEDAGFKSLFGMLPDEWREGGERHADRIIKAKADWDSRFAYWMREHGGDFDKAQHKATEEFHRVLESRSGDRPIMRPSPRQVDFVADLKEDIIQQHLHRLRYVPKIFCGTQHELDLAAEIENWCHPEFAHKLKVAKLAEDLRDTVGGYFIHKTPTDALEKRTLDCLSEISDKIDDLEADAHADANELRQLRAAKKACWTILYRYPKSFTDFTAISKYKIKAWDDDGNERLDRLIIFVDKNGRRSRPYQMPSDRMGSSQELRKFFLGTGGHHWSGNQDECDKWVRHIDIENYQRTIEEIDTYGWNEEAGIYLFMDCAVADDPNGGPARFLFPDKHGIIWHKGQGYKNSDTMAKFSHTPPSLFQGEGSPKQQFNKIDWDKEREEVEAIWHDLCSDFKESFGGYAGYVLVGGVIQYLAHSKTLDQFGKPSVFIQGEKGSGKTQTTQMAMRMLGFPAYSPISLGSSKVGIERALTRFRGLPLHVDEWRNDKVDARFLDLFIAAYNELAQHKGTPKGGKQTRSMTPLTPALITGEDAATDPALRSRYMRIVASPLHGKRRGENESAEERRARLTCVEEERTRRFERMQERCRQYYRVGRYLMRFRAKFCEIVCKTVKDVKGSQAMIDAVSSSRARENIGSFYGAILAAYQILTGKDIMSQPKEDPDLNELWNTMQWFKKFGAESNVETERDIFRNRFFADCVTLINRGTVPHVDRYLRVIRGRVAADNKVEPMAHLDDRTGRLLVVIRHGELFEEYQTNRRRMEGTGSPIAKTNILAELKEQPYWIPAPKRKPCAHRFKIPNDASSVGKTYWILDYDSMDDDLQGIFLPILEAELDKQDLRLAEDGVTIESTTSPPLGI